MWISEPTPVISSAKHIDSWSSCRPKSTRNSPTGTQLNRLWCIARCSASRPSMSAKSTAAQTNDASDATVPSRWPQESERLPASNSTRAPASGRAMSSHTGSVIGA